MYHKKTFTLSIPLFFIILVYSCKPSDKISEEDYKIINVNYYLKSILIIKELMPTLK